MKILQKLQVSFDFSSKCVMFSLATYGSAPRVLYNASLISDILGPISRKIQVDFHNVMKIFKNFH